MRACSAPTAEGSLWPVDAALRPEGKHGPLVRTVEQPPGLLRAVGQDLGVPGAAQGASGRRRPRRSARRYLDAVQPMVWQAAGRPDFVEDVQAMRRRVEQHVPAGGGRPRSSSSAAAACATWSSASSCSSSSTAAATSGCAPAPRWWRWRRCPRGGYVGREDAASSTRHTGCCGRWSTGSSCYRLRRTHLMPTAEADLRRLGRAMGHRRDPATEVARSGRPRRARSAGCTSGCSTARCSTAVARLEPDEARLAPRRPANGSPRSASATPPARCGTSRR